MRQSSLKIHKEKVQPWQRCSFCVGGFWMNKKDNFFLLKTLIRLKKATLDLE
jgi:hypothetical protein